MTEAMVESSWGRMLSWYRSHAPAMHAALRGPASEDDLTRAGHEIGIELPEDLLAWWRLADGVTSEGWSAGPVIPPSFNPWSVGDALADRRSWIEQWGNASDLARTDNRPDPASDPAGTLCYFGWLPAWLPLATDGMGNALFVDLRLGPLRGCVMVFDRVECANQDAYWPSVAAMLGNIADALESGAAIGSYPVRAQPLDDGHLEWQDADTE